MSSFVSRKGDHVFPGRKSNLFEIDYDKFVLEVISNGGSKMVHTLYQYFIRTSETKMHSGIGYTLTKITSADSIVSGLLLMMAFSSSLFGISEKKNPFRTYNVKCPKLRIMKLTDRTIK